MTSAERALLAKSRRGEEITLDDKLSVIDTVGEVDGFRDALRDGGNATPEALAACARRKVALQRKR
jgi:hypothetical protein